MPEPTVWFNPRCSKCRTAKGLLDERGIEADFFTYLDTPPSADDIRRVMGLLGISDPTDMARTGEAEWRDLGLEGADADTIIAAMCAHPILIERPIVIIGDRAVIARPPERIFELI